MKISTLRLRQFRNLSELSFSPSPGVNFIVGANGQGKTSILEAVSLLATLRSFRGAKPDELVMAGSTASEIYAEVDESIGSVSSIPSQEACFSLKLAYARTVEGKIGRSVFLNGKPFRSSSQFLMKRFGDYQFGLHAICFNPSDHDLVRLEPALRRQFLDRAISAENPNHLTTCQKYSKILEQRAAWLRQNGGPGGLRGVSQAQLGSFRVFSQALVEAGSEIVELRLTYLVRILPELEKYLDVIAPTQQAVGLQYLSKWLTEDNEIEIISSEKPASDRGLDQGPDRHFTRLPFGGSLDLFKAHFTRKLVEAEDLEIRQKSNLVGPHRDDWALTLNQVPLKSRGSQGEVRSALLALKIAEIELFRKSTGHRPILLLDDFSSELDQQRRTFLLEFLQATDLQVFVTTTEEQFTVGRKIVLREGQIGSDTDE